MASDKFFANEKALNGYKAQLYCRFESYLTDLFGMKEEFQIPGIVGVYQELRKYGLSIQ